MRPLGFSTGALAKRDFRKALHLAINHRVAAIEFSALRLDELDELVDFLAETPVEGFSHVSVHAPSKFPRSQEEAVVKRLHALDDREYLIIVHPDTLFTPGLWQDFGVRLCIENMDERKPVGRTCDEMSRIFQEFPNASFCFDVGHAHQVDSSMSEAYCMLRRFGGRLREIHASEVDVNSAHCRMGWLVRSAFAEVTDIIPMDVPIILEAVIDESELENELAVAREMFSVSGVSGA